MSLFYIKSVSYLKSACQSPACLVGVSPFDFQCQKFKGLVSVAGLKSWGTDDVSMNPSFFRWNLWVLSLLLIVNFHNGSEVYGKILFQAFLFVLMCFFFFFLLFAHEGVVTLVFSFFTRGMFHMQLQVGVSMEGVKFRSSYITILNWNPTSFLN